MRPGGDGPPPPRGDPAGPRRVGILTSWPLDPARGSGTAVALRGLARGLERLGHRVALVSPPGGGDEGLWPRLAFNLRLGIRPRRVAELDLLVGVDMDGFLLWPRIPYVVTLKGVAADEARHETGGAALGLRVAALLEGRNAGRARRVVVPSEYAARVAASSYGIPDHRLSVVPEPVDPPCRLLEGAWGRPRRHSSPTVLSVARQYPRKRTDVLLKAVPALAERVPAVRLRIVGDGPELPGLRRMASALGIADRVTFLGRVTERELALEYARAHCFGLPSEQEAYGIAAAEAMAAGLPVVGVRAGATPEVVESGVTGFLVEPADTAALAAALARVLTRPVLRARMGAAGRRVASRRGPEEHARAFLREVWDPWGRGGPQPARPAAKDSTRG